MATTKISIAIDTKLLLLARKAAKSERLSLSAYITRGLGSQLEEQERLRASRELYRGWGPASVPTPREREEFLKLMARPRKRRSNAA